MPLYLEIVDHDRTAPAVTPPDREDARILGAWTSESTGKTVRLVDAPEALRSPNAAVHAPRILFN